jgi:hypothetical protein
MVKYNLSLHCADAMFNYYTDGHDVRTFGLSKWIRKVTLPNRRAVR